MKGKMILLLGALVLMAAAAVFAQGVRKAVWAGQFYDADKAALSAQIDGFLAAAKPGGRSAGKDPGYDRAPCRLCLFREERRPRPIGSSRERTSRPSSSSALRTTSDSRDAPSIPRADSKRRSASPRSTRPAAQAIAKASGFGFIPEAHAEEHSIEVQVPFIQKVLPKAKIVPIVMGFPPNQTSGCWPARWPRSSRTKKRSSSPRPTCRIF